jgi:hypothetical protein
MPTVREAIRAAIVIEKRKLPGAERRNRSIFGYMEPNPDINDFAQCSSCILFLKKKSRCYLLANNFKVLPTDTCIMYVQGTPDKAPGTEPTGALTSKEVGYYRGKVRCENCDASNATDPKRIVCTLYARLNTFFPDTYDLDTVIESHGCCNAFFPK